MYAKIFYRFEQDICSFNSESGFNEALSIPETTLAYPVTVLIRQCGSYKYAMF